MARLWGVQDAPIALDDGAHVCYTSGTNASLRQPRLQLCCCVRGERFPCCRLTQLQLFVRLDSLSQCHVKAQWKLSVLSDGSRNAQCKAEGVAGYPCARSILRGHEPRSTGSHGGLLRGVCSRLSRVHCQPLPCLQAIQQPARSREASAQGHQLEAHLCSYCYRRTATHMLL